VEGRGGGERRVIDKKNEVYCPGIGAAARGTTSSRQGCCGNVLTEYGRGRSPVTIHRARRRPPLPSPRPRRDTLTPSDRCHLQSEAGTRSNLARSGLVCFERPALGGEKLRKDPEESHGGSFLGGMTGTRDMFALALRRLVNRVVVSACTVKYRESRRCITVGDQLSVIDRNNARVIEFAIESALRVR